ncbi:unnamed protein product [Penicillium salamii]|uniref:Uncharacterized protein n=1 Tax=Penicillium salamii TaxID=1612424 RepID=A0A9W4NSG2_9EURO|nr:unnamed protein product [Penicillium salamii]
MTTCSLHLGLPLDLLFYPSSSPTSCDSCIWSSPCRLPSHPWLTSESCLVFLFSLPYSLRYTYTISRHINHKTCYLHPSLAMCLAPCRPSSPTSCDSCIRFSPCRLHRPSIDLIRLSNQSTTYMQLRRGGLRLQDNRRSLQQHQKPTSRTPLIITSCNLDIISHSHSPRSSQLRQPTKKKIIESQVCSHQCQHFELNNHPHHHHRQHHPHHQNKNKTKGEGRKGRREEGKETILEATSTTHATGSLIQSQPFFHNSFVGYLHVKGYIPSMSVRPRRAHDQPISHLPPTSLSPNPCPVRIPASESPAPHCLPRVGLRTTPLSVWALSEPAG